MIFETHTTREAWEANCQQNLGEVFTGLIREGAPTSDAAQTPAYTEDDLIKLARNVRQRGVRASAVLKMDFGTAIGLGRNLQRSGAKLDDVDKDAWVEQRSQLGAKCDVLQRMFDLVRSERRQAKLSPEVNLLWPRLPGDLKIPAEGRKRLNKEVGILTLELTVFCISHALKIALPPDIEHLVATLLEKRKLLYRDDMLNGNMNDAEWMTRIQENGEWIKL
ncbi:MAG: hypothetical protein Q9184_003321 [Pyrenodesmia sp. 2 TL-2023]